MKTSKESELLRDLYNDWSHRLTINPNISIKDLRSMFDEWAQPALEPENVRYKSEKLGGVEAIWALPDEADSSSVIIYIHGGGFAVGSADSHRKLAGHLARSLNVQALILHYRLAPEHPFPAQIEDVVSAYKALLEQGYKADNLITAGDSAGGNLAIASVLKLRDLNLPMPRAVIAHSPWLDMALRGATLESNKLTDALVRKPILEGMVSMLLGDKTDPLNPLANPLESDLKGFPPLYIAVGGDETLLSDSQALHAKAKCRGVKSVLSVVPGMQHVFLALSGRAPEAEEELRRIADWHRNL
ncbi:alpha/beta hydrolase [Pseudomonas putida]|uniref:alpha/beta hydrolase n=1 Tax=Pseudomonas putida TaxID=303 RepID=UPI00117A32CC|nr:alpha/beta hydrolase [Pseudomonas putida]TRO35271.1 alpha/beta hydrolase [Pseudomonas putida]